MASIHVDIVSAEGQIHQGEAAMVFAPAEMGEVGIAPRHAPLLTRLKPGAVRVKDVNEAAAQKAKQRAEEAMSNAKSDIDLARAQAELVQAAALLEFLD